MVSPCFSTLLCHSPTRRATAAATALCGLLLTATPGLVRAQIVAPGGTGTGSTSSPQEGAAPGTVEAGADRLIITEVPLEQSVLPTVRPYTSAYGLDSNILDVPRNVTVISREQLDAISIQDVRDFSKLTSSSYTTSNFGAPANPSIRGFTADVFVNGQRRGLTSNGNGLPLNFNAVESVSILKGPASVIYGPSQYVGGYIDLVTKRPYFDKLQGDVSATFGMYDQYRWTLDFGGPLIKDQLAFRVSYSGEESGSFYENGNKDTQAVYAALTWIPSSKYRLDFNAEYFQADYTENFGVNRPTQDLIDHNRYLTGFVTDANEDGVRNNRDVNSGFNVIVPTGTIDLNRSRRLLRPGDGSFGRQVSAQAIQTLTLNDNFSVANNTFFNYVKRDTRSSYYYSEIIDNSYVLDNRTEFRGKFETTVGGGKASPPPLSTKDGKDAKKEPVARDEGLKIVDQFNAGFDFRYQHVLAYNDFFNEPANAWDLSAPRSQINYVNQIAGGSLPVPGHAGRVATPGILNGDTGDSNAVLGGVFIQNELRIGERFGLLTGGRVDLLYVHFTDPLWRPGTDRGDETVAALPNVNVSPTFRILPKLTSYFTFNYSQSTGTGNGGGYVATGGNFGSEYFHRESYLYEGGLKASLLKDTLFLSSAGFFQTRNVPTIGGAADKVEVYGLELEGNYQPNRNFYVTAAYTLLESFLRDQVPFSTQTYSLDNAPADARIPGGGILTDTFGAIGNYQRGDFRQPGLPEHLVNALVTYKTDFGLGSTLGLVVTGPFHNNYEGTLRVPWQYTLDLTVFYTRKNFEARLAFLNLTDQDNWSPPNPVYANDSIVRDLPFRIEGTVKFRF